MGLGRVLVVLASAGFFQAAFAQSLPPIEGPGREQQQFREAPAPKAQTSPLIAIPSTMPAGQAAKIKLVLKRIEVEGSTVYKTSDLEPLWAGLTGKQLSVADIYALRDRIRQKYSDDGWLLAIPVIVPQQASQKAAVIRIKVIEAYIDPCARSSRAGPGPRTRRRRLSLRCSTRPRSSRSCSGRCLTPR